MRLAVLEANDGDQYIHQWAWEAAEDLHEVIEWVDLPSEAPPDAILYMSTFAQPADSWGPGVPTAEIRMLENGQNNAPAPTGVDVLRTTIADGHEAIRIIAGWLRDREVAQRPSERERELIEVVIGELRKALDSGHFAGEDADDVAQTQAAVDTLDAQLKAPRPSRRVLKWALLQLPPFAVGILSSTASNYLQMMLS